MSVQEQLKEYLEFSTSTELSFYEYYDGLQITDDSGNTMLLETDNGAELPNLQKLVAEIYPTLEHVLSFSYLSRFSNEMDFSVFEHGNSNVTTLGLPHTIGVSTVFLGVVKDLWIENAILPFTFDLPESLTTLTLLDAGDGFEDESIKELEDKGIKVVIEE